MRKAPIGAGRLAAAFCAAAALTVGWGPAAADPLPPEPAGYRMDDYRSPTPATLRGARVVSTREAEALWRDKGAAFVDTMPRDARPKNLPPGTVWRDKPREHIPGSVWLANVGYGGVSAEMADRFRSGLAALSGGDKSKPLLFYCRAECWMSWNAAKRAMEWGYSAVIWYPDGTDGWEQAGLGLEPAAPYEPPAPAASQ